MTQNDIIEQVAVSAEVQRFLADIVREGMTVEDVLHFLEKPWKWQDEFSRWREHQAEGQTEGELHPLIEIWKENTLAQFRADVHAHERMTGQHDDT